MHRTGNAGILSGLVSWLCAGLLALALGAAHLLDGPDDLATLQAQEMSLADVIEQENQQLRFERAAAAACGQNAAWVRVSATEIQCYTKRGKSTSRVTL